jgi:glutathione S-transferase
LIHGRSRRPHELSPPSKAQISQYSTFTLQSRPREASSRHVIHMLTVWGRSSSLNTQKVMWLLGELGVEHRHIQAGGQFGGLDTPEFRAMNPFGRVPVIDDDGTIVWESHAILRYLAAQYGEDRFWSNNAADRSQFDRWMEWSHTTLQPDFLNGVFWGLYRTPESQRNWRAIGDKIARCVRHFQFLNELLAERRFLCGSTLTLADIPAGTLLYRYFELDIDRPSTPNVEAWYQRLRERSAYSKHVMIPFAELRGRLDY